MFQLLLLIIYLAFISLGLPDSLLGSAWPTMYQEFSVPISYAGGISMIIAAGTIISSLQSDRLTKKLGTGKVTAISVLMTAVALLGFSVSHSYAALCLWAIPYGLGAGSVDASLNNYVALHYASRHMSWLHCMWGVGASLGPYIMGYALTGGQSWNMGYRYIAILQIALTAILFFSLPLWKKQKGDSGEEPEKTKPLSLGEIVKIPGAKQIMVTFFCYCALEQTAGLWASSYLVLQRGLAADTAASFASLFYVGITAGRAAAGFLTMKLNDTQMIRLGQGLILVGIVCVFLPFGSFGALAGLILIGTSCSGRKCGSVKCAERRSQNAAPVMTTAGGVVRVPFSSGTTVAGVRAVATVISAPSAVSEEIISDERCETRESVPNRVPSRSLT